MNLEPISEQECKLEPLIGSSVKKQSRKVGAVIHRVQTEPFVTRDLSETSQKSPCIYISTSMHPTVHKSALLRQRDVRLRDKDRPVTLSMCGKQSTMTHCFSYVPDKEKANTSVV